MDDAAVHRRSKLGASARRRRESGGSDRLVGPVDVASRVSSLDREINAIASAIAEVWTSQMVVAVEEIEVTSEMSVTRLLTRAFRTMAEAQLLDRSVMALFFDHFFQVLVNRIKFLRLSGGHNYSCRHAPLNASGSGVMWLRFADAHR